MPREQKSEVRTVIIEQICDCGGKMQATGQQILVSPPRFEHRCISCGLSVGLPGVYPQIGYEPIETEKERVIVV